MVPTIELHQHSVVSLTYMEVVRLSAFCDGVSGDDSMLDGIFSHTVHIKALKKVRVSFHRNTSADGHSDFIEIFRLEIC